MITDFFGRTIHMNDYVMYYSQPYVVVDLNVDKNQVSLRDAIEYITGHALQKPKKKYGHKVSLVEKSVIEAWLKTVEIAYNYKKV